MLENEEKTLLDAMAADLGKPAFEGWMTDVGVLISEFKHMRSALAGHLRPERVQLPLFMRPGKAQIVQEPLGVILVMSPWNYPINLAVSPLAAALAAGNAAVLKPSELSPATSEALALLLPRYVDPEATQVVTGGQDVATELLAHPFDHIVFTGSSSVGKIVMKAAAANLTPVTLELGGKSPAIIDPSADLEVAARRIAQGKVLNAGQTCIAPDHIYVPRTSMNEFLEHLGNAFAAMVPDRRAGNYTRIVSRRHFDRLVAMIPKDGVVFGGEYDTDSLTIAPTIVVDPDPESPLMTEEIFGPLLPVVGVGDVDDAIDAINAQPKPLALYVFGTDEAAIDRVIRRTSSAAVGVNQTMYHAGAPRLPFGGVGNSGTGRYRGMSGVDRLSNPKSVLRRGMSPDPGLAYPPYGPIARRVLRRLI